MNLNKLRIIFLVFCLYFGLILVRLFKLQVIDFALYRVQAQFQRDFDVILPAKRGEIFAKDGFPLAQTAVGFVLNFDKNLNFSWIKTKEKLPELVKILLLDQNIFLPLSQKSQVAAREKKVNSYISSLLQNPKIKAGVIYKNLSEESFNKIEKLKIPGFYFSTENLRVYPEASMSAHLIGFLGRKKDDSLVGVGGLEGYFELELKGQEGLKIYEKDALGKPIMSAGIYEIAQPLNGRNLLTSIDRGAQKILEKWLAWGVEKFAAKTGTAILYDPYSGEIAALANFPNFNPNKYFLTPEKILRNLAIEEIYEPGSIMKPLVMAMALEEKKVTPSTPCPECYGPVELSGYVIKNFDDTYKPNLTMTEILERSDNTGMTFVSSLLGKKKMLEYFHKLGFGNKTNVDLMGEVTGYVKKENEIYDIDRATMAFGQGISVTSLQMIRAYGALVTGYLATPHCVTAIVDFNDGTNNLEFEKSKLVFSQRTREEIAQMLFSVTEISPLHFARDRVPGLNQFKIAAKSGTAQIPLAGKYEENATVGSVIGFAPLAKPKYILLVKLDEPKSNPWGANTAGPIFFNIWQELFLYYGLVPF